MTAINLVYGFANLARGQATARVTPKSWWTNMRRGWVWDLDGFLVNQIGHPYQGSMYFAAGRANGLGFYESAALAAFGSGTWEYFGETNPPSLNDFVNTTLGGAALGEMTHRAASLLLDRRVVGGSRRWREIVAAAVDPLSGVNRHIVGDATGVVDTAGAPAAVRGVASLGVLRRGNNIRTMATAAYPFVQVDLSYGDTGVARSRTPFDVFGVRFTAGGGGGLSEARVRGRLLGEPVWYDRLQFSVVQTYHYLGNDAYHFGAQSFEAHVGGTRALSPRTDLRFAGWGGLTVLGAVDSRPLRGSPPAASPPGDLAGQGGSAGPREYDYGPGTTFGASAAFTRRGWLIASALYEGRTLYSLDGVRANHVLQRARLDVIVPIRGRLGAGAAGEFFDRRSFYQDKAATIRRYHFPQFRLYLAWSLS